MQRLIGYRGFKIHISLTPATRDMYTVTFRITGHNVERLGSDGAVVEVRHGPFTYRWAYLVAEIAGQAAIDVILGPGS